jgi:hypothetical protein
MTDYGLNEIKIQLNNLSVHVIPYCHADFAWIHTREWHIKRYRQIINGVLDIMAENPSYTWMTDNVLHILKPFYDDPECRSGELTARINEGRIEITGSMMSLLRPTTAGQETFIRNIAYGRKWFEEHGISDNQEVFHSVDVSIGHSQLPQLLNLAGFKYYRGWRPQGALDAKGIPREFIWKGIDESRIVCSRGTYAGLWKAAYLNKTSFQDDDGILVEFYDNELDDIVSHVKTGEIWLPFGMDDTLPMKDFSDIPVNLDGFMDYLRKTAGIAIKYSTAKRYFEAVSAKNLIIYDGLLDPCDVSYNIPTKGDRGLWHYRSLLETLITKAETLWLMASNGTTEYPTDEIDRAWENLLFISGHAMEFSFKDDYEKIYNLAQSTIVNVNNLIQGAIETISGFNTFSVGTNLLINPIESPRKGIYSIFATNIPVDNFQLMDSHHNPVEFQIVDETEILVDISIPGFGITALDFKPCNHCDRLFEKPTETPGKIKVDTGDIKVVFSSGSIESINDLGFDSVSAFGKLGFTEIDPAPNDAWLHNYKHGRYHQFTPSTWHLTEEGPLRWKYEIVGSAGPASIKQQITLTRNSPVVGYDILLDCIEKSNGFFSISFPAGKNPKIRAGIPFGFETRPIQDEPFGKLTDIEIDNLERLWPGLFYGNGWMSYKFKDIEFSLISERMPSYYWYDKDSESISAILTRTFNFELCKDWMNETHQYNECMGKSNFKFSILAYRDFEYSKVYGLYKLLKNPPENIIIKKMINTNCQYSPPMEIISESCFISSLYKNKGSTVLRVFNASDMPDKITIKSSKKILSCRAVDFQYKTSDRTNPFGCNDFTISTILKKHEILTLEIDFMQDSD